MTPTEESFALLLHSDGTFEVLAWPGESTHNLGALYRAIVCTTVDAVTIDAELTMWVDSEGKCTGSPVNFPATRLYATARGTLHQIYHGSVVITGGPGDTGETRGLTRVQVIDLLETHMDSEEMAIPAQRTK